MTCDEGGVECILFGKCQSLESLQDSLGMLRNGILQDSFGMLSFLRLVGLRINGRSIQVRHEVAHLIVNRRVDLL